MSANQSNLSDPHYGYDLVVAVTQKSINTTLKQFLAGIKSPEVILCYVYDPNNNLIPIDYKTLVANAKGSDPFAIANGADPKTNTDLINLANANFAGAVKAKIGLPNVPLNSLPPIAVLGHGASAPAQFNLLCSEFQIAGFQYGARGMAVWINMSQSASTQKFWYFSGNVEINKTMVDRNSPVPPAVQQRIIQLQNDPANAFSIQKLFLDLDTAILLSTPTIEGLPSGWAVWNLISTVFLGAYFKQMQQSGNPVLSYSFTLTSARPATMILGSVSRECLPLLNNGQPINNPTPAQLDAAQLVYIGSTTTTPPIPVPFSWNWVDLADVTNFSGVLSVRRDVFLTFLGLLANQNTGNLCYDSSVVITTSGLDYHIAFATPISTHPSIFIQVSPIGLPAADGFTKIFDLNFNHNCHGYNWVFASNLNIDYNYTLVGDISISHNKIRVTLHPQVFMQVQHLEVIAPYTDLPGANYYDKIRTITYDLNVDQNGAIKITESDHTEDKSVAWNLHLKGLMQDQGFTQAMTNFESLLSTSLDNAMTRFGNDLANMIGGYQGWVFPGNDAFTFKNVGFSNGLDLIAQLTYVNPN